MAKGTRLWPWTLRFRFDVTVGDKGAGVQLHWHVENGLKRSSVPVDRTRLVFRRAPNERFFGLGEQFSFWALNGLTVPVFTRENGISRGGQSLLTTALNRPPNGAGGDTLATYSAIPFYVSSGGPSVLVHAHDLVYFNFTRREATSIEVVALAGNLTLLGTGEGRLLDVLEAYTRHFSGRMREIPAWTDRGAIIGIQGGEAM